MKPTTKKENQALTESYASITEGTGSRDHEWDEREEDRKKLQNDPGYQQLKDRMQGEYDAEKLAKRDYRYYMEMPSTHYKYFDKKEAEHALKQLAEYDDGLQRHNFAFTNPEIRGQLDKARARMGFLRDIINPPPPPPSKEEIEAEAAARREKYAKEAEVRRQIQPTKQKMREQGVFEKIGSMLPDWAKRSNQYGQPMAQPGDGDVPAVVQKYVALQFLRENEMPQMDWILGYLLDRLVDRNELQKPSEG